MKKKSNLELQVFNSFVEGQDADDHYNLIGDLEVTRIIDCQSSIHCCRFSPNGEIFAVGLSNGAIKIYDRQNNQPIYILLDDDIKNTRLPVTSLRFFNPPNDPNLDHYKILIACYVSGFVKFWHYPSKSCVYTIKDKDVEPLTIDLNLNGDKIAVGGYNTHINVYDIATKKLLSTLESNEMNSIINGHTRRVYCVKYDMGEPNRLVSGGWDDTIQIWDDRVAQSQSYISGPHVCGDTIDIDTRYNHMLTGSWRKSSTMQIWDLRSCSLIRDVFKHKANMMIYGCHWLASSYIFAGGSEKNSALVYDRGTLNPICGIFQLKNAVTSIDNDRVGDFPNLLVATSNLIYQLRKKSINHHHNTTDKQQQKYR